jgi:hypothetical protein
MDLTALTINDLIQLYADIGAEFARRLSEQKPVKEKPYEVPLRFDDSARTIYWRGGNVRLGRKKYLFVKPQGYQTAAG